MKKILFSLLAIIVAASTMLSVTAQNKQKGPGYVKDDGAYQRIHDEFTTTVTNPYYDNTSPEDTYNPKKIKVSLAANVDWPVKLADCANVKPLQNYLLTKVLGASAGTQPKTAVRSYLTKNYDDIIGGPFGPGKSISIKPGAQTKKWSVYVVNESIDMGSGTGAGMASTIYGILFDKKSGRILTGKDMISNFKAPGLLKVVNKAIDGLNRDLSHTEEAPTAIVPEKKSLVFVFAKYTIGCGADGEVQVRVPYSNLLPYLTPVFKSIMGL